MLNEISKKAHRLAVSVFFFVAGISFFSWTSRIPDIKNHLHLGDGAFGGILLALPAGLMVSLPVSGWSVARFGSKLMVTIAATGYPLVLILIGLAGNAWELAGVLFLFGLFGNLLNISINTQAVGVEYIYQRSIMTSFHGTWSLAGFAGATIGNFLISRDVPPSFHFSIICILMLALLYLIRPFALAADRSAPGQTLFAKPDAAIMKLGLIAFGSMICEGTMFDWSGVYFQKVVLVPRDLTIVGLTAFTATMAGGRFIGDWFATRLGIQRMLQISGVLITSGLLTAVIFPHLISATLGFLLVGLGVSSVVPLVYSAAGKSRTMSPGIALAAVSTIGFGGFLLGPPLIGFLAEMVSLRLSFAVVSILGFGTAVLATFSSWPKNNSVAADK